MENISAGHIEHFIIDNDKLYCDGKTEVSKNEFEFTLDIGQATKSLFNSFEVNITSQDINFNYGFLNGKVKSIYELVVDLFIGTMNTISNYVSILFDPLKILEKYIESIIIPIFTDIREVLIKQLENWSLLLFMG